MKISVQHFTLQLQLFEIKYTKPMVPIKVTAIFTRYLFANLPVPNKVIFTNLHFCKLKAPVTIKVILTKIHFCKASCINQCYTYQDTLLQRFMYQLRLYLPIYTFAKAPITINVILTKIHFCKAPCINQCYTYQDTLLQSLLYQSMLSLSRYTFTKALPYQLRLYLPSYSFAKVPVAIEVIFIDLHFHKGSCSN